MKNTYGLWSVTTENDEEGRTVKNLGTFKGHIDEIALHLADKCYYSLCFKQVEEIKEYIPKRKSVSVMFGIDSGTWKMSSDERVNHFKEIFKDRNVKISDSNYYASFTISTNEETLEDKKRNALNKLTPEEKLLLGLK
jgi:hypothetical protein